MVRQAIDALVASLGDLSAEQQVHAAAARRLADLLDEGSEVPPYALPAVARELRAAVATLAGAPTLGQGVSDAELAALLGDGLR